jgi:hypothetical protein
MIEQFNETEHGTDNSFFKLNKQAQAIALGVIDLCKNHTNPERAIVRDLDTNLAFREAIGVTDFDTYPQEVDVVVRYWRFVTENQT